MNTTLQLDDLSIDVVQKDIKNVHLSVYPPNGAVRIAAPADMPLDTIRVYAITKLDWIRTQQQILRDQPRESDREYVERESHYVWGQRYLLTVTETAAPVGVSITPSTLQLNVRSSTTRDRKHAIVTQWYRDQLKAAAQPLVKKWESRLGVEVNQVFVQHMKTKWGSCAPTKANIRLNTELAKKPRECLEYIVVHELMHLLEPTHNARFIQLMDQHLPLWRQHRAVLNSLPLRHEDWDY